MNQHKNKEQDGNPDHSTVNAPLHQLHQTSSKEDRDTLVVNVNDKHSMQHPVPSKHSIHSTSKNEPTTPITTLAASLENNLSSTSLGVNESECFRLNSPHWIDGPRLGNEAGNFSLDTVQHMLTGPLSMLDNPGLFAQTICYETSRFRNISDAQAGDASLRAWTLRLLYLSMIHHQQRHAIPEAEARLAQSPQCADEVRDRGIGIYDYECQGAKFLVTSLAGVGLGANMRGGAVHALLAGLVSNRVVLFINNGPTGHKYLRSPWRLTSCPRRDYQCFFFPSSPCVLTHHDLQNAYSLSKLENKRLLEGIPPKGHENDKVWHVTVSFNPQTIPPLAVQRLHNYSHWILGTLPPQDPRLPVLRAAADNVLTTDAPRPGLNYGAANVKIHHALVIFSMRPNLFFSKKLSDIRTDMKRRNIDPERSVGLPIRGV